MRLAEGGEIDRTKPLRFVVDDVSYEGFEGDTLASAMLANGVLQVAPSLYKQRPRGIFSAGVEEPNALVQVGSEPSLQATTVKLTDGLVARTLSGIGRLVPDPEEPRYDKRFTHTDVLVIGAGPAGRTAAKTAASGSARVILAGMSYPSGNVKFRGSPQGIVGAEEAAELRVLHGATAFGYYDSNYVLVAQGQTLWHIRARRVILATGAHEQPIVFENNDRPGIMLAGAVRKYITKYAVLPGRKVVVFTTNDSAYGTVAALVQAGAEVTVVDSRPSPPDLAPKSVEVISGVITNTEGEPRITAVSTRDRRIECDLLAVSGGWQPAVHLFSQSRGTLKWTGQAFVPDTPAQQNRVVGAANGTFDTRAALIEAAEAGVEALFLRCSPVRSRRNNPSGWYRVIRRTSSLTCNGMRRSRTSSARSVPGCGRPSTSSGTRPSARALTRAVRRTSRRWASSLRHSAQRPANLAPPHSGRRTCLCRSR